MSEVEQELEAEEAEAAEAAADSDEQETTGDEEAFEGVKTAPEQAAADEKAAQALDKALTAEDNRHNRALGKLYGDEWPQHVRCALCDGIGFLHPELASGLSNDQWAHVVGAAIAMTQRPYIEDSNYERCEHCDGWGQTLSGARDPEHYTKLCDVCSGNGFIQRAPRLPSIQPVPAASNGQEQPTFTIPSYGSPAMDDQWGRPGGHPHYGIPPAAVQG